MVQSRPLVVITAILGLSLQVSSARAQGLPSAAEAARDDEEVRGETGVVEIREVERGFFFAVDMGPSYFFPVPVPALFVKLNENFLMPGQRMGVRIGYDILPRWNVEFLATANFNRGLIDRDVINAGLITGDVVHLVQAVSTRFSVVATDRFHAYVRAGAGLATWLPPTRAPVSLTQSLFNDFALGIHSEATIGIEYYTQLRHLSVGLEATAAALYLPFAVGVQVYPTLKYTF